MKTNLITLEVQWFDEMPRNPGTDYRTMTPGDMMRTATMQKMVAHQAVEVGEEKAQWHGNSLVAKLTRLAERVALEGCYLSVRVGHNWATTPAPYTTTPSAYEGLGVEVWCIKGHKILWDIRLYSGAVLGKGITFSVVGVDSPCVRRGAANVAHLLREIEQIKRYPRETPQIF